MNTMNGTVLGLDLGGVIRKREDHTPVEHHLTNPDRISRGYLEVPTVEGALGTLHRLMERGFSKVVLISKLELSDWVLARAHAYLEHHGFRAIRPENRRFCSERAEKADICLDLEVTHYVDDRLDVLRHMIEIVPHLFLFQPHEADRLYWHLVESGRVQAVHSWPELAEKLLKTL